MPVFLIAALGTAGNQFVSGALFGAGVYYCAKTGKNLLN